MRGVEQGVGGRQGSGRLVGGETVELPRLLSLVQAVSVKVRLRVEVVVGGHLLVQPKVLHPHCLQKIRQQSFKRSKQIHSSVALTPFSTKVWCKFNFASILELERKGAFAKKCLDLPLCEGSRGKKRLLAVIEEPPVRVVLCRNGISTGL